MVGVFTARLRSWIAWSASWSGGVGTATGGGTSRASSPARRRRCHWRLPAMTINRARTTTAKARATDTRHTPWLGRVRRDDQHVATRMVRDAVRHRAERATRAGQPRLPTTII